MAAGGHGPRPANQEARAGGPGLGDAKRPAAPPREARGSREAGAERKTASKTSGASPRRGRGGVARLGRKGKERLCGPFFTLGDEARGAEGRKRRKQGRR